MGQMGERKMLKIGDDLIHCAALIAMLSARAHR